MVRIFVWNVCAKTYAWLGDNMWMVDIVLCSVDVCVMSSHVSGRMCTFCHVVYAQNLIISGRVCR